MVSGSSPHHPKPHKETRIWQHVRMHAGNDDHSVDGLVPTPGDEATATPSSADAEPATPTADAETQAPPAPTTRPDTDPQGTPTADNEPAAPVPPAQPDTDTQTPPTSDIESQAAPAPTTSSADAEPAEPVLPARPDTETQTPPTTMATVATPSRGGETWYRTDQDRFRSVHRRANPWYRRLARGLIGLTFLAAAAIGLFFAARVVQDFLDRDRLPSQGADVPTIRATSFEIRSTAPAPELDGTLTLDTATKAFEFTGRGTGSQAGVQVVSPDGVAVYQRVGTGGWELAGSDGIAADAVLAVSYLADDDSADDILTSQLRRGYVDLINRTEIGTDDEVHRYELRLDTRSFEADFPLQYRQFADEAIPGVQSVRGLLVTITLDDDDVLIAVDDAGSNWSWQRLAYSDQPFTPLDPADQLAPIEITDGTVDDG